MLRLYSYMRLGEKIGMPLHLEFPFVKNGRFKEEIGGVHVIRVPDVTNIPGTEIQSAQAERPGLAFLNVCEDPINNTEFVDLHWINGLEGLLPPAFLYGDIVFVLLYGLLAVNRDHRLGQLEISDHPSEEQSPPLHTGSQLRNSGYWWIRVCLLLNDQVLQLHSKSQQMKMSGTEPSRIAL